MNLDVSMICFLTAAILMLHLCWVDLRTLTIPDLSILGIAALGVIYRYVLHDDIFTTVVVALGIGLFIFILAKIFERVFKKPALGYGDVKLFIATSLWFSVAHFSLFFIITGVSGVIFSLIILKQRTFAFAPAIGIGWFSVLFLLQF